MSRNPRLFVAIAASLLALVALEGVSRLLVWRGSRAHRLYRVTQVSTFWADLNPDFGVWHRPHATFHHTDACWDVTYQTNSYGARDAERAKRSSAHRRHLVLGDSFIEGYAIRDGERLTDRLNVSPDEEFLNFGTAGVFGTIQELVLYRTLASSFEHSDVLLFVLPANDFEDNDPQRFPKSRYRPYLRRGAHGYEIYYTVSFDDRDVGRLGPLMLAWNWLSNQLYFVNLSRQPIERRLKPEVQPPPNPGAQPAPTYAGHSDGELETMTEAIRELVGAAGSHPVHVFLIPVIGDLIGYRHGARYELPEQLRSRLDNVTHVDVTDLLPDFAEYADAHHVPASSFFLPCDPHWSSLGNAVAAAAVARHLR